MFLLSLSLDKNVLAVELKFAYALLDVVECTMAVVLLERQLVRVPASVQLFYGANVDDPVVEMFDELGHVTFEEQLVDMNRVASERTLALSHMCLQEIEHDCTRIAQRHFALAHRFGETAGAMLPCAPLVHVVQNTVRLVDDKIWRLGDDVQVFVGYETRNLQYLLFIHIQATHLEVNPHDVIFAW